MTIVKATRGTGITKREFFSVRLDEGDQHENAQFVSALFRSFGKILEEELAEIDAMFVAILSAAGLPASPGIYTYCDTGQWKHASQSSGETKPQSWSKLIAPIADAAGFAYDSEEGFAARIVDCTSEVRRAQAAGDLDKLGRSCIRLGSLLTEFELKAGRPDGPSRGGIKGSAARWSSYNKSDRQETLRQAFSDARRAGLSKMTAYADAARKTGASIRSVQRAVAD